MSAKATHIYVLGFTDDVIKVGRTSNPTRRFAQHQQDAKIRRASIAHSWLLEHELSNTLEWFLRSWASFNLEHLTGEYFSGDFESFMAIVDLWLRRTGIIEADQLTFRDVEREFGVTFQDLVSARLEGDLLSYRQIGAPVEARLLYLREDVQRWFDVNNMAALVQERAEDRAWNRANRGGVIEASRRRRLSASAVT